MEIGTVNFDDLFDFSPEPPPPAPEPLTSGPEPLTSGPEPSTSGHRNTLNAQDAALLARMQANNSKDYYTLQPQHQLQQQQQQQQHQQQQQRMEQGTSAGGQYNSSSYNASRNTSQSGQVGTLLFKKCTFSVRLFSYCRSSIFC
jgi:hypothetical protein